MTDHEFWILTDEEKEKMNDKILAKNVYCSRCRKMGIFKKADVFVGLNDPDSTKYPMCKEHAKKWRIDILLCILELDQEKL